MAEGRRKGNIRRSLTLSGIPFPCEYKRKRNDIPGKAASGRLFFGSAAAPPSLRPEHKPHTSQFNP